ncbi:DUF6153 family protein [Streptomyces pinistramenti]|uniref:DUF6153 family protein n=1 Tax=Streptomyces pinistramenti TaxID=2884812 RepID=UPI001D08AA2D|nr:DUF6153 family protein [Streptomyces pinistramenti]MCB5907742.1 DUF6153 family protein [Streptomyces pinistramenti]
MAVRETPWQQAGGAVRCARSLVIALLAVLAVLLHHEISADVSTTGAATAAHAMPHAVSTSAEQTPAGSVGQVMAMDGADGAACPSTAMQHCSSAGLDSLHLTPPAKSPLPAGPTHDTTTIGTNGARTTSRAPPDLSVLSQLRI